MNRQETSQLLVIASTIDNRSITEEAMQVWHGLLDDVDYADAVAALKDYYRTETKWLMPAHIRDLVVKHRADARREKGRSVVERRDWLTEHGIEWSAYEAGDPAAIAAAQAATAADAVRLAVKA